MRIMNKEELRETRKQMFAQMEQRLQEMHPKEEDRMFYYHSSEDRIVLSHALFWVMTQPQCLKGKISGIKSAYEIEKKCCNKNSTSMKMII